MLRVLDAPGWYPAIHQHTFAPVVFCNLLPYHPQYGGCRGYAIWGFTDFEVFEIMFLTKETNSNLNFVIQWPITMNQAS